MCARDEKWPKNGTNLRLCSGARDENGKKLRLCSGFLAEFSLNLAKKREKAKICQKNNYTTEKNCQKSGFLLRASQKHRNCRLYGDNIHITSINLPASGLALPLYNEPPMSPAPLGGGLRPPRQPAARRTIKRLGIILKMPNRHFIA